MDDHGTDAPPTERQWRPKHAAVAVVDAEREPQPPAEPATTAAPLKKKKRKKKGADAPADTSSGAQLGSAKAIETMFRNAIRAELELIALAAAKANIMISLNGFIISALMISGALLFNSSPTFLIPAAVFMLTSGASIAYALFAASPERTSFGASVKTWWTAFRAREAKIRELPGYVMRGEGQREESNLLIYEDRVKLERDEYWEEMQDLLRDRDEIYHKMSDQLYWLGEMASRKFKMLNISYSIFRWGLLTSIVTFLAVKGSTLALPYITGAKDSPVANMGISEFTDIYEPSAVQQLNDGRILVVEDEPTRAMNLLTIDENGTLVEDSAADLRLTRSFGRRLNDLEGLSVNDNGTVFAITSHSGDADGKRVPDREQLLRFEIRGAQAGNVASYTRLRDALSRDTGLQQALTTAAAGEKVSFDELNIEGLAYYRDTDHLMLGLRDPMVGGKSLIVPIENPDEMFDGSAAPRFGAPILLDLQDGGIRALSYDPVLGAFLIVNEIEDARGDKMSQIWRWTGDANHAPEPLSLPSLINLNNVESIDSVTIGGEDRLLIMSDDGDPKADIAAKYLVLDYDQLPQQGPPTPSDSAPGTAPATPAATPAVTPTP